MISNLALWLRFLSAVYILVPLAIFVSGSLKHFGSSGLYVEHFCEIVLNLGLCFRSCHLKKKFTDTVG